MRTVHLIVIHCSATKENETFTEMELEKSHRQRGLNGIGYHYYIRRDGNIKSTRPVRKPGAIQRLPPTPELPVQPPARCRQRKTGQSQPELTQHH